MSFRKAVLIDDIAYFDFYANTCYIVGKIFFKNRSAKCRRRLPFSTCAAFPHLFHSFENVLSKRFQLRTGWGFVLANA
jgi:hypothetical protein